MVNVARLCFALCVGANVLGLNIHLLEEAITKDSSLLVDAARLIAAVFSSWLLAVVTYQGLGR